MRFAFGGYALIAQTDVKQKLCCRLKGSICGQVAVG
jgi:hypothetical protein